MDNKTITVVGLSHKTTPVEVREKLNFPDYKLPEALTSLKKKADFSEILILSTCNRVEVYCVGPAGDESINEIKNFLAEWHNLDLKEFIDKLYIKQPPDSIEHIFRVAAGLDAMVVGEYEILGQVKRAYTVALNNKTTAKIFNILFQKALAAGKEARTKTDIGKGLISVGSVAVQLAEKIFGDLNKKKVMIFGAGETAELTARHLFSSGADTIFVANRTYERAKVLAEKFNGIAVHLEDGLKMLKEVDVVISSTSSPHYLLKRDTVANIMKERHLEKAGPRPIFFIDLSVPRDIDPDVNKEEHTFFYDIDDLEEIVKENLYKREKEIMKVETIIAGYVKDFLSWYNGSGPVSRR